MHECLGQNTPCEDIGPHYFMIGCVIFKILKIQCGPCGNLRDTHDQVGTFLRGVPKESAWAQDSEKVWVKNRSPQSVPTRKFVFLALSLWGRDVPTRISVPSTQMRTPAHTSAHWGTHAHTCPHMHTHVLDVLILVGTLRPHKDKVKNTNFLVGTSCGDLF